MLSSAGDLTGQATLVALWQALAGLSPGAWPIRSTAVAAVFPSWLPLNNAILLPLLTAIGTWPKTTGPGGVPRSATEAIHGSVVAQ